MPEWSGPLCLDDRLVAHDTSLRDGEPVPSGEGAVLCPASQSFGAVTGLR